ncbi:MAG TPA: hypothetical protein VFS60_09340 [Thermoanaerobaculia bacterium]|nr:hypothetical protein [Thermoanaerobaculia bacterium]
MRQLALAALAFAVLSSALLAGGCASSHPTAAARGETVTGKVVSFTDASVTIETTTGNEVIGITAATEGRDRLIVGAQVAIDVQRNSGRGEPVATQIRPAGG